MLTPRRARFVAEYMRDLNAAQAALRAGYAPKSARNYGKHLLHQPAVAREIARRMDAEERRSAIRADRVLDELIRVAFSDVRKYVTCENGRLALVKRDDLAPDDTAAVMAVSAGGAKSGARIRLHDKRRALRALARHVGLFEGRGFVDPAAMRAEADALAAALLEAAASDERLALPAPERAQT